MAEDGHAELTDQRQRLGVDDIIAGALFYNNVLTSSLIHTQIAYATVNHELNSHSNNEPPNSQKIFMSNGHDLTPRYCLGRREYYALRPHSDHKRGITVNMQHCTVVVSSDHNGIPRCTLVISSRSVGAGLNRQLKAQYKNVLRKLVISSYPRDRHCGRDSPAQCT